MRTLLAVSLILAGCAQAPVMLHNTQTGQTARCEGVGMWTWGGAYRLNEQAECIRSWEQHGFTRSDLAAKPKPVSD